jgi:hypothetical protein
LFTVALAALSFESLAMSHHAEHSNGDQHKQNENNECVIATCEVFWLQGAVLFCRCVHIYPSLALTKRKNFSFLLAIRLGRDDIRKLDLFMKNNKNLKDSKPDRYKSLAMTECSFLFSNYTDIFNKILSEELDFGIMSRLLLVLKLIEDKNVDQNEGSVMVGKILKELYIDSAMKRGEHLDAKYQGENEDKPVVEAKSVSWTEWKKLQSRS